MTAIFKIVLESRDYDFWTNSANKISNDCTHIRSPLENIEIIFNLLQGSPDQNRFGPDRTRTEPLGPGPTGLVRGSLQEAKYDFNVLQWGPNMSSIIENFVRAIRPEIIVT